VRIVSATHKNLTQLVAAGQFRQDLYYRLNVIDVVIAPLRERSQDLPALCQALLARIAEESGAAPLTIDALALAELGRLPLDGNVRELENLLHRAVALGDGQSVQLESLHTAPAAAKLPSTELAVATGTCPVVNQTDSATPLPSNLQTYLDELERQILCRALQDCSFNRTAAAERLGLSLRQMRYRIARLQIDIPGSETTTDSHD
jgi:two-component system response regulator PilR (NtrC family)